MKKHLCSAYRIKLKRHDILPAINASAAISSGVLAQCWELNITSSESQSELMYLCKPKILQLKRLESQHKR